MSYAARSPIGAIRAAQTRVTYRRGMGYASKRGMGQPPGYLEVCGTWDYACSQRNIEKQIAYYGDKDLGGAAGSDYAEYHGGVTAAQTIFNSSQNLGPGNWVCTDVVCVNLTTGERKTPAAPQLYQPAVQAQQQLQQAQQTSAIIPPTQTIQPTVYSPRVTFQSVRGGSTLYPSDTWSITLTGAAPGAEIWVQGGKNGTQDRVRMGTADPAGRFTLAGTANSSELGTWNETWTAGGLNAGSFSFSIVSGPGGSTTTTTTTPSTTGPVPSSTVTTGGSGDLLGWFSESLIGGIPNWVLLAGGVVAFKMFGGKK